VQRDERWRCDSSYASPLFTRTRKSRENTMHFSRSRTVSTIRFPPVKFFSASFLSVLGDMRKKNASEAPDFERISDFHSDLLQKNGLFISS